MTLNIKPITDTWFMGTVPGKRLTFYGFSALQVRARFALYVAEHEGFFVFKPVKQQGEK